jgi:DNA invertase Pin-like site-specific DNA recombinase
MVKQGKRVAIYTRVSTKDQTTETQLQELRVWADRAGHTVVKVYCDHGISGAKGRDQRPEFDAVLKAAVRREFDMLAVWSSDRLGRSLSHLVEVLQTIKDTGTGLYIHTQSVDTTTPSGRAMFGMLGIFSEFEREMIVARVKAGMERVTKNLEEQRKRDPGKTATFTARTSGVERRSLGRPGPTDDKLAAARTELAKGTGIVKTAKLVGLGVGTVHKLRRDMSVS